jgi:predicted enzyme related to lactoylglutathione lyase
MSIPQEVEFVSNDIEATNKFLVDVFDWKMQYMKEFNMGMGSFGLKTNVMITKEGDIFKTRSQRTLLYLTVKDVDKEVKRLSKLGAEVAIEPKPVPLPGVPGGIMGHWAYVKVPGDVIIGLWADAPGFTPPAREATKGKYDDKTMNFYEIVSGNPKEAAEFFKQAYQWDLGFSADFHGQNYWYWHGDGETFSIGVRPFKKGEKDTVVLAHVNLTANHAQILAKAKKNGAKAVGGKIDYAPHGNVQYITIPGGPTIGLWESPPRAQEKEDKDKIEVEATSSVRPKRSAKTAATAKMSSANNNSNSNGDKKRKGRGDDANKKAPNKRATKKAKKD